MKRILAMLAVVAILGLAGTAALVWRQYGELRDAALISPDAEAEIVEAPPGSSLRALAKELARRGHLDSPWPLRLYSRYTGDAGRIRRRASTGSSPRRPRPRVALARADASRRWPCSTASTVVEGWTVDDLLAAVASHRGPGTDAAAG
ncbi:MAG: hypothetical protein U5L11_06710 [Arhodomonas sp.]|nr:hypothetical protein [Arhodomonas sp.]